ncbi:YihY/virulence factor BrkB family protein [Jannaschia sp. W003]|uniref:YihY/virulence factor BrkB family protein n=1 Tax=Jannaschia sp. W003 TaxID=2867012 RepID=UPI0021A75131|nr:YihY/virulence factor BrkB family protein [Jannaschia sp. W003]UWQ20645.1 YihY/virulence factor BrkB family protein [Jannaschia sp. W003]
MSQTDDDVPALSEETAPTAEDPGTGHDASTPAAIPATGWREIAGRVWIDIVDGKLWTNCGCVGFFGFLSIFPVLAIFVLLYGLLFDAAEIDSQLGALEPIMPGGVYELLVNRLAALARNDAQSLTVGLLFSLAVAMWTGTRGTNAVIDLLNLTYHEEEPRSFLRRFGLAVGMTMFSMIGLTVVLLTVAALPLVLSELPIGSGTERLTLWLRWPILAVFVFAGLALLYRRAPNRRPAKWRWLMPGALLSTLLWIGLSVAFSAYVEWSDFYGATFGTLSVAAVLMLWIYYSALAIAVGGIVNAEIELQTRRDSTRGRDRPRGLRGAVVADRLPPPPA